MIVVSRVILRVSTVEVAREDERRGLRRRVAEVQGALLDFVFAQHAMVDPDLVDGPREGGGARVLADGGGVVATDLE